MLPAAQVDVHLNHMLRERFEVSHLPTILLFRERKVGAERVGLHLWVPSGWGSSAAAAAPRARGGCRAAAPSPPLASGMCAACRKPPNLLWLLLLLPLLHCHRA